MASYTQNIPIQYSITLHVITHCKIAPFCSPLLVAILNDFEKKTWSKCQYLMNPFSSLFVQKTTQMIMNNPAFELLK